MINSFLLSSEEKKILIADEKKGSAKDKDFYYEALTKLIYGEMAQYRKKSKVIRAE